MMSDHITKGGRLGPLDIRRHSPNLWRQVLRGLADDLQISYHGIEHQAIFAELIQRHILGEELDFRALSRMSSR